MRQGGVSVAVWQVDSLANGNMAAAYLEGGRLAGRVLLFPVQHHCDLSLVVHYLPARDLLLEAQCRQGLAHDLRDRRDN